MAGSTGLNLSKANHLILVDPWYNPSIENQAMERIHRIGRKNFKTKIFFHLKNSKKKYSKLFNSSLINI